MGSQPHAPGGALPLSLLQKRILRWLYVEQLHAPQPTGAAYEALVTHLPYTPASIARSLQRLARRDLVRLTRSAEGHIQSVQLTQAGHLRVWLLGRDSSREQ
jgi:DNA-binding MarR family transcriptional regulator